MPADFETGFFGNGERAWHGLGNVIAEDTVETARALELSGPPHCRHCGRIVC